MPKGDSLKRYKEEQKIQTRIKLEEAIRELKASGGAKITVDQLATICGISRATIYANYKDLLENLSDRSTTSMKLQANTSKAKDAIIADLRDENKKLRLANNALMDQIVGMKILLEEIT
jgi:AcrR family transcriptional regulator